VYLLEIFLCLSRSCCKVGLLSPLNRFY
jgi:hypothetical protein